MSEKYRVFLVFKIKRSVYFIKIFTILEAPKHLG